MENITETGSGRKWRAGNGGVSNILAELHQILDDAVWNNYIGNIAEAQKDAAGMGRR